MAKASKPKDDVLDKRPSPNDELDLSDIDYKRLKEPEMFRKYVEIAGDLTFIDFDEKTGDEKIFRGQLKQHSLYDYQLFRVRPVFKQRHRGMKDSPKDLVGLELRTEEPEHTTRIDVATALNYNKQIDNAHAQAGHGKYYLLKK